MQQKINRQEKMFCFQSKGNILFFFYYINHPIMMKNGKFDLGRVRVFTHDNRFYCCDIKSSPHLNSIADWNEEYFSKLFYGFPDFDLVLLEEEDQAFCLFVRDTLNIQEEVFLLRANLAEDSSKDITNQFWNTYQRYNNEKIKILNELRKDNIELIERRQQDLIRLKALQIEKETEKDAIKGKMSALLREKEAKLKEFGESFIYGSKKEESEFDLVSEEDRIMQGSLFQNSQEFMFDEG